MSLYTIKKVPIDEVDKLVTFIDLHWKKGHALVKSRPLLDFQHLNKKEKCYNFIVAENNETHEYDALVGFIPTAQYDESLEKEGDYWGAIWKFREDVCNDEINNVAFYIWKRIFKQPYFHSYAAIGISNIAKRIYEVSRIPVDYLRHYYIANSIKDDFFIGKNLKKGNVEVGVKKSEVKILSVSDLEKARLTPCYNPIKSIGYIINRYSEHPIYKYVFWGIYNEDKLCVAFVTRKVEINGNCVLRIVDALGDLSCAGNIFDSVQLILKKENAEYIDLLNFGIEESVFRTMGFQKLDIMSDEIIVPNYFEPFEQRNVKLEVAYKSDGPYVVFKGDSDQDRPNIL